MWCFLGEEENVLFHVHMRMSYLPFCNVSFASQFMLFPLIMLPACCLHLSHSHFRASSLQLINNPTPFRLPQLLPSSHSASPYTLSPSISPFPFLPSLFPSAHVSQAPDPSPSRRLCLQVYEFRINPIFIYFFYFEIVKKWTVYFIHFCLF